MTKENDMAKQDSPPVPEPEAPVADTKPTEITASVSAADSEDTATTPALPARRMSLTQLAHEVWAGNFGYKKDVAENLKKAGHNVDRVRSLVELGVGETSKVGDTNYRGF